MMDIKLIASDMDDTLLNSTVTISERKAKAIKSALAAGKIFFDCDRQNVCFCASLCTKAGTRRAFGYV